MLTLQYTVGVNTFEYREDAIFGQLAERLLDHDYGNVGAVSAREGRRTRASDMARRAARVDASPVVDHDGAVRSAWAPALGFRSGAARLMRSRGTEHSAQPLSKRLITVSAACSSGDERLDERCRGVVRARGPRRAPGRL
jgi:hypothetical protein